MSGAASQRGIRNSQLVLHWRARDLSLNALTGHVGRFLVVTPVAAHTLTGRNGTAATAGRGMPRFNQITTQDLTTRLSLIGDDGAKDIERLEWDWPLKVMSLSIYVKTWPLYTPGQNLGGGNRTLLSLGNADTGGGSFSIYRSGTQWFGRRGRGASSISDAPAESGTAVFPMEVLATLSAGGTVALTTRDAANDVRVGSPITDANMMIPTESWAGNILYLSGGSFRIETIKISRGVQTMSAIAAMS